MSRSLEASYNEFLLVFVRDSEYAKEVFLIDLKISSIKSQIKILKIAESINFFRVVAFTSNFFLFFSSVSDLGG